MKSSSNRKNGAAAGRPADPTPSEPTASEPASEPAAAEPAPGAGLPGLEPTIENGAGLAQRAERVRHRELRRLEKRLATANEEEQKRIRQLARARRRREKLERSVEMLLAVGAGGAEPQTGAAEPQADAGPSAPGEAYCVREHRKVALTSPIEVVLGNHRAALAGKCPSCGATVYRIVGVAPHPAAIV